MYRATGHRKTATAQVIMTPGEGNISINKKSIGEYYQNPIFHKPIYAPLQLVGKEKAYDITVKVAGSGPSGQAQAIRHAIARALIEADPELKPQIKAKGFLTRDARKKERSKAGLRGARKDRQYRKR
ncbi:MAG TPA: 30S ribosomal protein S9 [Caldisericia bacterium]|nr:30S ribosomal protein S9 [Caldisericia bacterium]HPF49317.1 30S ribosomal protein S9 [Caldisericia bacterium]HPI84003.1 30S ribosomal protein S9 [Caldisericia bacterium]HPQ93261.1 30S ribosomal protein S9 [Caldisericia bacterium]HRV75357.1 30S ribosomal protein S9 [Caldisericia bacterium]